MVLFPKQIDFPAVKIHDFLTQAVEDIITILANTPSPTVLSLEAVYEINNALKISITF